MNFNVNDVPYYPESSKTINFSNQGSNIDNSAMKIEIKKDQLTPVHNTKRKKSDNQFLSMFPRNNDKMKNSVLSVNPERETSAKKKQLKNTFISLHNPLKISNKNLFNIMPYTKRPHFGQKNKLSLGDTQFFMQRRNSHQNDFHMENHSRMNLRQVQRELQFKLLDMSIQIENDSDNEGDYIDQQLNFKRNTKKRFTEHPRSNLRHNSYKKLQTENKLNNVKFSLSQIKKEIDLNNYKTNNTKNDQPKNNKMRGRRQSFMPKSFLYASKFDKTPQPNNQRLNLSVNMNLYRDLIPNINMNISQNECQNLSNKSMFISKKKINIKKILLHSIKNEEFENKYRLLMRQKELYDSFEDEEVIEELEDEYFFISPETIQILIFDTLILFCTLFGSLYLPLYIAQSKCFCSYMPQTIEYILFFYEGINIIDILISFFRAYYNYEFVLEKKNTKIVIHYLKKYFFLDALAAIPFFTISYYFCNFHKDKPDGEICLYNGVDLKFNFIKMLLGFKLIKLKKVLDKKSNRGINYFYEVISENYTLEKTMKMLLFIIIVIIGFNFFICYHIYIGLQSYPNWILKTNNQDSSFITIYISSFYFLIATITSVGYGDITCVSLSETLYQIIILTIGVIAYSWIVSTIGNAVKKETRAAIKFNKDLSLLEEIRVSYPKMSFKLYNKIYKHLETVSHQQEKLDTNLLVTNLPYTLKNQIMFIIYGSIIKKFIFFKDCENSDFILRVLTAFIPLSTKKGAFIIQEGEIIDNIVFVREGRLSLVATIDLDNPLQSIENYLGEKFEDINDKMATKLDNSLMDGSENMSLKKEKATTVLKTVLKTKNDLEEENIEEELAKKDFNGEDIEIGNMQFLNILDILKNEHYGIVYMFLKKPAPLSLRVKSKYSQLFLLRKNDTMQISKAYPNVWKKIYHKSYHNMKSIKKLTKKIIINYCRNYGHKYEATDDTSVSKGDTDFLFNLGILNPRKRKNTAKKISFNLGTNNNQNNAKPKSILRHKLDGRNENLLKLSNKSIYGYKTLGADNYHLNSKVSGTQMNTIGTQHPKSNTNINQRNISFFSSKNRLSSLYDDQTQKPKVNQINQINNNINYNIVINDMDMNNDSKTLLKPEENKKNSLMKKSLKHFCSINNFERSSLKKSYFMQNVPITIKGVSNLSKNNLNLYPPENPSLNKIVTLNMPNNNINNNNNVEENNLDDNTLEMDDTDEKKSENSPITINDLSKSLLKKVKKKIKKRRKRKKLYKMLVQKITESIAKVNPNINLSSSMNNNSNSIILSSKIGDVISMNPELNYIIDEKPELNPNITQSLSQDINQNNLNHNINPNVFPIPQSNEFIPFFNPQELFLIPESIELSSSESSSENSSDSSSNKKEESSNKNNNSKINNKIKENNEEKKKIELTISENTNFTLNNTYDNLNKLSEGNYSKDVSLQKSVEKLIIVYLSEKEKKEKTEIEKKKNTSVFERSSIVKSPKIKVDPKEKDKEQKKEKDVWSFLDDGSKKEESEFNIDNQKNKDSFEKVRCKSPQARHKKTNDISKKKKTKKIYDNLFSLDESTPKNKKAFHKKKSRRSKNKTTVKRAVSKRKIKKKDKQNSSILNLHTLEKEEENSKENNNIKKDVNEEKEKAKDSLSSSEFSDMHNMTNLKETYKNKNFKTYQINGKKKEKNNEANSDDNSDGSNSKDGNNFG